MDAFDALLPSTEKDGLADAAWLRSVGRLAHRNERDPSAPPSVSRAEARQVRLVVGRAGSRPPPSI